MTRSRYNDLSRDVTKWSPAKLVQTARYYANLDGIGCYLPRGYRAKLNGDGDTKAVLYATERYRQAIVPILDEIDRRFVRGERAEAPGEIIGIFPTRTRAPVRRSRIRIGTP